MLGISRYRYWGFTFLMILLSATYLSETKAADNNFIGVSELTSELKTKKTDRIINAMNTIKQTPPNRQTLIFLHDLWDEKRQKHPDLPWELIKTNAIKLEIADILLQADANKVIKINKEEFHRFVLALIDTEDEGIARNAIMTLSIIDDGKDVDKILIIAKRQHPDTFRASVLSLTKMCNPEAEKALDKLEKQVTTHDQISFLKETRSRMTTYKERTNWCSGK